MRPGGIAIAVGGVVVVGVLGAVIGYAVATPSGTTGATPVEFSHAAPMPAKPSLPIDPPPTYAPDPDYPALGTSLTYDERTFRDGDYIWHYPAPHGWVEHHGFGPNQTPQVTWRPLAGPGLGPESGGAELRIAPVGGHSTPGQMISAKDTGMEESQAAGSLAEFQNLRSNSDTVWYSFRTPDGRHRFNDFSWITNPGPDGYVGFEISVSGRDRDQPGLDALIAHVHDNTYRTTRPKKSPSASALP